jgi:hypothetical protein
MWSPISTTAEDYRAGVGDMNPVWQAFLSPSLCFHTVVDRQGSCVAVVSIATPTLTSHNR